MQDEGVHERPVPTEVFALSARPPCKFCGAKKFPLEPDGFCCSSGEVKLYPNVIPDSMYDLFMGRSAHFAHFLMFIRAYNNSFAFTSLGVTIDKDLAKRNKGIYTFRVQGQVYHFINHLNPSNGQPSYLQLYFFDTEHEVQNRMRVSSNLDADIVTFLIGIMSINPYYVFFRSLREVSDLDNHEIRIRADPVLDLRTYNSPSIFQVATIWHENDEASDFRERDIVVQKNDGHSERIRYYFGCYDPLQYPLLFPLGEPGWHQGIKRIPKRGNTCFSEGQSSILAAHASSAVDLLSKETLGMTVQNILIFTCLPIRCIEKTKVNYFFQFLKRTQRKGTWYLLENSIRTDFRLEMIENQFCFDQVVYCSNLLLTCM